MHASKKVAIVHDWLTGERGGEKVLRELLALFPQAELFTLFYDTQKFTRTYLGHPVHTSFLQAFPAISKYYRYLLPLFPMAVERLDLRKFDLVVSSSHCVAKGVIVAPTATHVSYCHTPMRYVWDCYQDYFPPGFKEQLMAPFLHYLRTWDAASAGRVDKYIATSTSCDSALRSNTEEKPTSSTHRPIRNFSNLGQRPEKTSI
ncbi:MAG: hypothetical protein R3B54_03215 [Bdellovibrionota bacterium]